MLGLVVALTLCVDPGVVLFDAGEKGWLVMSRSGAQVKLLRDFVGMKATNAAVSPDGTKWGFISAQRLYVWQEGWRAPKEIPRRGDVLKDPAFSSDGAWLYFIQNDFETMSRAQQPMRYSQVWRVRAAGGDPEKVSKSAGCHMWPAPVPGGAILVTHATCIGGRGIDLLSQTGTEKQLRTPNAEHGETASDPSGRRIAFVREVEAGQGLFELDIKSGQESLRTRIPWRNVRLRPSWSTDGKTVWLQNQEAVWASSPDGTLTEHISFQDIRGTP